MREAVNPSEILSAPDVFKDEGSTGERKEPDAGVQDISSKDHSSQLLQEMFFYYQIQINP